jgi:putative oxygen-independent coproporphyrinogen III oxidase
MMFTLPKAAYIHIPFCRRRCFYCDFAISVVGDAKHGGNSGTIAQYLNALTQEIGQMPGSREPLETIFFGGGTPSLLTAQQLDRVLRTLELRFGIAPGAEIAMEIDPGTFDGAKLRGFRAAGVNRFSFGVQAFDDRLLENCGRSHRVADIDRAMQDLKAVGVTNFSLDLISGLPTQTLADWDQGLDRALAYSPPHLSIYDLTIEPGTAFAKQFRPGDRPLPSDETTAEMYRMAHAKLTAAGYEHYEVSNYAKPGFQCRHNRVYWENRPFYGFGMGATSCVMGDRVSRPRKLQEYYDWQIPEAKPTPPLILDTLMVGLRLAEGLGIAELIETFGQRVAQKVVKTVMPYVGSGWVAPIDLTGDLAQQRLRLTVPEGFLFSNVVLIKLFELLDDEEMS